MTREYIIFTAKGGKSEEILKNEFLQKMNTQRGYPIVSTNAKTGLPAPAKQQTVRYAEPIVHSRRDTGDLRLLIPINEFADKRDQEVITEEEAKKRGFLQDTDLSPRSPDVRR